MSLSKNDIDDLLQQRSEIDEELRRHRTTLTVLFTDVVGSTGYFNRFGDTAGVLLMHRHDSFVTRAVEEFHGTVIKTIGDSVMAEFPGPVPATCAAMEIQQRLLEHNSSVNEAERLQVRTGINTGQGFRRGTDVYGEVINLAARITKRSGAGQILISRSVRDAIAGAGISCRTLGMMSLDGMPEPAEVFEVAWTDAPPVAPILGSLDGATDGMNAPELERYEILARVGSGGMGVVFKARDRETEEIVALKVLHPGIAAHESHMENFRNEMRLARKITHKNVCRIYDFNRAGATTFLSMEFVQGESLRRVLERFGALGTRKAVAVANQICEGLREVHAQGMVHRDLKPENLMIDESGNVKIMDFGLARSVAGERIIGTVGTPSYMAPEQIQGAPMDQRADIYTVGLVLFEVFTGSPAVAMDSPVVTLGQIRHSPPDPRELEPSIPEPVATAILQCLENDPAKRFQSIGELQTALAEQPRTRLSILAAIQEKPLWAAIALALLTLAVILPLISRLSVTEPHQGVLVPAGVAEIAAFRIAESLGTEAAWNSFLKNHPQSGLASTARVRLENARAQQAAIIPVRVAAVDTPPPPPRWAVELDTVFIPAGVFTMGNDNGRDDEKPQHPVRLNGFQMGRNEVTNRQYLAFLEDTGYRRPKDPGFANDYLLAYPGFPVLNISHEDAVNFCKWASAKFGVAVRLPTEAEWEYAARGSKIGEPYPWGAESPEKWARFRGNATPNVRTVKRDTFPPNSRGLYNMSGNVSEWVHDFYSKGYYTVSPVKNPAGPESGRAQVVRGGSWADDTTQLGVSRRSSRPPGERSDQTGFRIVVDHR